MEPTLDDLDLINELYPTNEEEYDFYLSTLLNVPPVEFQKIKAETPKPTEIIKVNFREKKIISREFWI